MESFLITVGYGSLALLGTAIGVALLEHWRQPKRGQSVSLLPGGDAVQRQATVSAAMARMAQPNAVAALQEPEPSWIETRPMVGIAPETEPR